MSKQELIGVKKFQDTVLIFDAVKLDDFTVSNYLYLKRDLLEVCHTIIALHANTPVDIPSSLSAEDVIFLSDADIFSTIHHCKTPSHSVIPGNRDLKDIAAFRRFPTMQTFIFMEYDVLCIGDPSSEVRKMLELFEDYEIAVSFLGQIADAPNWMWWESLVAPKEFSVSSENMYKSFLPLQIARRSMMDSYIKALENGWRGHHEVLVPTIAKLENQRILDLSQTLRKYTSFPQFTIIEPEQLNVESLPAFIHPVKTMENFNNLPESIQSAVRAKGF